ncbi:MAG: beta-lactamase family protein [Elusimicrobia bacterium]|nr:beta-lactamase family protein [Elusimicrobiota bacterium]
MRTLLILAALTPFAHAAPPPPPDDLNPLLAPIRAKHNLPALAAAVLKDGRITSIGAVGTRHAAVADPVTVNDLWHLGSDTKAMTATLIARLVERGRLSWDLTLEKAFPEIKLHPLYKGVTLEKLLTHTGGLPADVPEQLWSKLWERQGTNAEQRMTLVKGILTAKPGTRTFRYSNAGYAIAGAIAERAEERSWEELIKAELFQPLGMKNVGFGAPGKDQPWGHQWVDKKALPMAPGPQADNPPGVAPAGAVHASLKDWAKFVLLHLNGARGLKTILHPNTFRKLHTAPAGSGYAMGWMVVERPWAGGRALTHAGSNTMWYAVAWLAPEKDFGILITTNLGDGPAARACDETAAALIKQAQNVGGL